MSRIRRDVSTPEDRVLIDRFVRVRWDMKGVFIDRYDEAWVESQIRRLEHRERRENCLETLRNIGTYI